MQKSKGAKKLILKILSYSAIEIFEIFLKENIPATLKSISTLLWFFFILFIVANIFFLSLKLDA